MKLMTRMRNVWLGVGTLVSTRVETFRPGEAPGHPYGLLIVPSDASGCVGIRVWAGSGEQRTEFQRVDVIPESILHAFPKSQPWALDFFSSPTPRRDLWEHPSSLAAEIASGDVLTFEFTIDTNSDALVREASRKPPGNESLLVSLPLLVVDLKPIRVPIAMGGELTLALSPLGLPADYDGAAAIDLGNTTSTFACLPAGSWRTRDILLLDLQEKRSRLRADAPSVPSCVRIEALDKAPQDHHVSDPQLAEWQIGFDVERLGDPDGLLLNPKRLLARRSGGSGGETVFVASDRAPGTKREVRVPDSFPAELFVCRMYQAFSEASLKRIARTVITFPTTYTPREVDLLRAAVARAWLRARREPPTLENLSRARDAQRLLLDEASAGAFFFLYRRIFEQPGSLRRFRYLYPDGLNLLIYDCGGGTTDLGLVHAHSDAMRPETLTIRVRCRGGHRGFGGDDITLAIARLIKAKLARKLVEVGLESPIGLIGQLPLIGDLGQDLDRNRDAYEALIPTGFDPDTMDLENRRRRALTLDLWNLAEQTKRELSNRIEPRESRNPSRSVCPLALGDYEHITAHIRNLAERVPDPDTANAVRTFPDLDNVSVSRDEVDELVQASVSDSVRKCNALIRTLVETGEEVHLVVVAGGGSRYPLVQETLRNSLHIPFLTERIPFLTERIEVDATNLKHAVAKGALLAIGMLESSLGVRVEFDSGVHQRLLFDVALHDLSTRAYRILFSAGEPHSRLVPVTLPVDSHGTAESRAAVSSVLLHRRWEGELEFSPFLSFSFPSGVTDPITVEMDPDLGEFMVIDASGIHGEIRYLSGASAFAERAVAQSGEL